MHMAENMSYPSIFNDVLGPVMRGPSSSHCAAANRIGHLCRDLVGGDLKQVTIESDPNGALMTTHKDQGTDMGLYGGFLGWDPADPRLPDFAAGLRDAGLEPDVRYIAYGASHPNTYRLTFKGQAGISRKMEAVSTGGGMIEVQAIDDTPVHMIGDLVETLWHVDTQPDDQILS